MRNLLIATAATLTLVAGVAFAESDRNTTADQSPEFAATLGNPGGTSAGSKAWSGSNTRVLAPVGSVSSTGSIDARSHATTMGNDVTFDSLAQNRALQSESRVVPYLGPGASTTMQGRGPAAYDPTASRLCIFAATNCSDNDH